MPIKDLRSLSITWPIPDLHPFYKVNVSSSDDSLHLSSTVYHQSVLIVVTQLIVWPALFNDCWQMFGISVSVSSSDGSCSTVISSGRVSLCCHSCCWIINVEHIVRWFTLQLAIMCSWTPSPVLLPTIVHWLMSFKCCECFLDVCTLHVVMLVAGALSWSSDRSWRERQSVVRTQKQRLDCLSPASADVCKRAVKVMQELYLA